MLQENTWEAIKGIRKGCQPKQGRLRDLIGKLVDSAFRAETIAEYLEQVHWQTQFPNEFPTRDDPLGETLPIDMNKFTEAELSNAIH